MVKTITVELAAIQEFKKLFSQLARKAKRLNIPAPSFVESGVRREVIRTVNIDDVKEVKYAVWVTDVVVNVEVPVRKSGNWECVAVVKRNEDGSLEPFANGHDNIQRAKAFLAKNPNMNCDHCNSTRTRNTTILLHDGERIMQVGKECASEYNFDASEAINEFEFVTNIFRYLGDEDEDSERGGYFGAGARRRRVFPVEDVLDLLIVNQHQIGRPFEKSRKTDEYGETIDNPNATWATVLRMLTSYSYIEESPNAASLAISKKVREWLIGLDRETLVNNEYLASLHAIAEDDYVSESKLPLFASAFQAFTRESSKVADVVPTTQVPEGRVVVTGKVVSLKRYDTEFGVTTKMLMVLEDGNRVFCTATGNAEIGKAITIKVTLTRKDDHFAFGKIPKEFVPKLRA